VLTLLLFQVEQSRVKQPVKNFVNDVATLRKDAPDNLSAWRVLKNDSVGPDAEPEVIFERTFKMFYVATLASQITQRGAQLFPRFRSA
jgi:hypothetical protein